MNNIQAASMFMLGYAVRNSRPKPRKKNQNEAIAWCARIASQIVYEGGAFNPIQVYEMEKAAEQLGFAKLPPPKATP